MVKHRTALVFQKTVIESIAFEFLYSLKEFGKQVYHTFVVAKNVLVSCTFDMLFKYAFLVLLRQIAKEFHIFEMCNLMDFDTCYLHL